MHFPRTTLVTAVALTFAMTGCSNSAQTFLAASFAVLSAK
jgi:hypothetical protein